MFTSDAISVKNLETHCESHLKYSEKLENIVKIFENIMKNLENINVHVSNYLCEKPRKYVTVMILIIWLHRS